MTRRSRATPANPNAGAPNLPLGPGPEFDAIRGLLARWGTSATGIGDDCAVVAVPAGERLCASTDSSVENVHFRREWLTPREIGYRATAAALSDLAAMAARPLGVLVAITLPASWRTELDAIADGIGEAATRAGTVILGGDLSAGGELSVTLTVLGSAAHPLGRHGARAGDHVYVTGALGASLGALRELMRGERPSPMQLERFARPQPRLKEARWLAEHGASAAIDISDGLGADLGHLAAASGVRIALDLERVPLAEEIDPRTGAWRRDTLGSRSPQQLMDAATSGEEYELVVTIGGDLDEADFVREFHLAITEIGRVETAVHMEDVGLLAHLRGARVDLPRGHDHLSR